MPLSGKHSLTTHTLQGKIIIILLEVCVIGEYTHDRGIRATKGKMYVQLHRAKKSQLTFLCILAGQSLAFQG